MSARAEHGVVLLTVLLIVALASLAVLAMLDTAHIATARSANLRDADQAYLYALAAEDHARSVLARDARAHAHAGETLSAPLMLPDGSIVAAAIDDLQARFNLNNLVRDGAASEPDVLYFRRLLRALGLAPELADAVVDWIDADRVPRTGSGAEDEAYLERDPPHLAANRAMSSTSELRILPGFSAEAVALLEPHVTALPEPTPLNLNTAGPLVLASLAEGLDLRWLEALIEERRLAPFERVEQFFEHPALRGRPVSPAAVSVDSRYFRLRARASAGRGAVQLHSVLRRDDGGRVDVLMRSRGEN